MCHVFRCDSVPAKEIANCLRDTCRRIINEKKLSKKLESIDANSTSNSNNSNGCNLKFNDHNDFIQKTTRSSPIVNISKHDFSKFKSFSCNDNLQGNNENEINKNKIEANSLLNNFLSPMEEPKKSIKCKYLGNIVVNKPSGMDILNEAIEKIYLNALADYKRIRKQNKIRQKALFLKPRRDNSCDYNYKIKNKENDDDDDEEDDDDEDVPEDYRETAFSFDLLDINNEKKLGIDVEIIVSPSTVTVKKFSSNECSPIASQLENDQNLLFECRIRYLSFMGISNDVRY
jgi:hypothetical protein